MGDGRNGKDECGTSALTCRDKQWMNEWENEWKLSKNYFVPGVCNNNWHWVYCGLFLGFDWQIVELEPLDPSIVASKRRDLGKSIKYREAWVGKEASSSARWHLGDETRRLKRRYMEIGAVAPWVNGCPFLALGDQSAPTHQRPESS